jgi:hypothetical protein
MDTLRILLCTAIALIWGGGSSFCNAANTPIFDVSFAVITKRAEALARATPEQMRREVDILNTYFVGANGIQPVLFRFKSLVYAHEIPAGTCSALVELGDLAWEYDYADLVARHAACEDTRAADRHAINIYVYDGYSADDGFDDIDSHGVYNRGRPIILLDWERLNHSVQSPEEHEMGHVFGLDHVCAPDAGYYTPTNIMTSYYCGLGGNGLRNLGFDSTQLSTIQNYASRLAASLGMASFSDYPLRGILTNSLGGYFAVFEAPSGGANVVLQVEPELAKGAIYLGKRTGSLLEATSLNDNQHLSANVSESAFFGTLTTNGIPRAISGQTYMAAASASTDGVWQSTATSNRYFATIAVIADASAYSILIDIAIDAGMQPSYNIALGKLTAGDTTRFDGQFLRSGNIIAVDFDTDDPSHATFSAYTNDAARQLIDRYAARQIFAAGATP